MMTHKKRWLIYYLPLLLGPLILFAPLWVTGKTLFWGTPFLQFMPWRSLGLSMILKGQWPLWDPLLGMGAPLAANLQSAFYYPPNWFLFLLGILGGVGWMAWGQAILVILHLTWAGLGMALLARKLGLKLEAQGIAGLSFALSGYLVARAGFLTINAAVAWIPWIILAATRFANPLDEQATRPGLRTWIRDVLGLAVCLGMQWLAGHAQTSYYTLLLLASWVILGSLRRGNWKDLVNGLGRLGAAGVLAFGLAAIQLIPGAEYLLQSQRSTAVDYSFATNYSYFPLRFLTLFSPNLFGSPASNNYLLHADNYWEDDLYMGLLPILLALGAAFSVLKTLFTRRKKDPGRYRPLTWFLIGVTAVAFLLALGANTPVFPFLYLHVPTFNMFQAPTRFTILAEFSLCLLAGIGTDAWKRPVGKATGRTYRGLVVAFAFILAAGLAFFFIRGINPIFPIALALTGGMGFLSGLLSLYKPRTSTAPKAWIWDICLVAFISADLLLAGWGLNPGASRDIYTSPASGLASLKSMLNGNRLYLSSADESQLKYDRFLTFNHFSINESWSNMRNILLPDANIFDGAASVNNFDPLLPERYTQWIQAVEQSDGRARLNLFALMDVGAVESVDKTQPLGVQFIPVENATRVRWMSCAQVARDGQESLAKTLALAAEDQEKSLFSQVVVEAPGVAEVGRCDAAAPDSLSLTRDEPDQVGITLKSTVSGWVFLADSWYPGWEATIDGNATTIYRADFFFRAIQVPPGRHTIQFTYHPLSFTLGLTFTIMALVICLGLFLFLRLFRTAV